MAQKRFSKYKEEALKHGIKILDIYRSRDKEVVRFIYKDKVYLATIKGYRENITPDEFIKQLLSVIKS